MMNQTNNLIQWKNLTDEQKAGFDFENYEYEYQGATEWLFKYSINIGHDEIVYRLKIEPDKWYYTEYEGTSAAPKYLKEVTKGDEDVSWHNAVVLRPAKPSEIPEPVETLEDRVKAEYGDFKIIMLFWAQSVSRSRDQLQMVGCTNPHYVAQSTKGFYQYCYEKKGGGFYLLSSPIGNAAAQPVAVLFSRGEG